MVRSITEAGTKVADRVLIVGIAVLMLGTAWGLAGVVPGPGFRVLATLAAGCLLIGGFVVGRGTRSAFTLLWAAVGVSLALGVIGLFSIGAIYIGAGLLIMVAIGATPNRSGLASRFDRQYVLVEAVVFLAVFAAVF